MDEIDELLETLQENEAVEKKFFEVEVNILSILNFKDFFESLFSEIREKFLIPYVWVTFIEDSDKARMILDFASSELLNQKLGLINKTAFMAVVGNGTQPILINDDLRPYYKMLPQSEGYLLRSMAIAPITLDGDIIGSLNFGDTFGSRYFPGMDTSLLERLAVKVSICLSNVMAHEKVTRLADRSPI